MEEDKEEKTREFERLKVIIRMKKQKKKIVSRGSAFETKDNYDSGPSLPPFVFHPQNNPVQVKKYPQQKYKPVKEQPKWLTLSNEAERISMTPEQAVNVVGKGLSKGMKLTGKAVRRKKK